MTTTPSHPLAMRSSEDDVCCDPAPTAPPSLGGAQTATLADRLKALADPTRLRMLDLLVEQAEPLCVCDITAQFDLHQPTISHHLRLLRQAQLIQGERRGVWTYYGATEAGRHSLSMVKELL